MEKGFETRLQVRRRGDTLTCVHIWKTIVSIAGDRKPATLDNIRKYCGKMYGIVSEKIDEELQLLLSDKLVSEMEYSVMKGRQKGSEVTVFTIPDGSDVGQNDKHDWYCFICHKPGEVLDCSTCPRVFHIQCLTNSVEDVNIGEFVCSACRKLQLGVTSGYQRKELNLLIGYACARLESKFSEQDHSALASAGEPAPGGPTTTEKSSDLISQHCVQGPSMQPAKQIRPEKFLLRCPMDILRMESKAERQVYKDLAQLEVDSATIVHNAVILHGENSPQADAARAMYRDCLYEIAEIKLCRDCYRRSNEQDDGDWFCHPCSPPHELVYARAKGYPFWPAKLLQVKGDSYDVRFFGEDHSRATLGKAHIKPITANIHSLVPKARQTNLWKGSIRELEKHRALLAGLLESTSGDDSSLGSPTEGSSDNDDNTSTQLQLPPCKKLCISLRRLPLSQYRHPLDAPQAGSSPSPNGICDHQDMSPHANGDAVEGPNDHNIESDTASDERIAALENKIASLQRTHAEEMAAIQQRIQENVAKTESLIEANSKLQMQLVAKSCPVAVKSEDGESYSHAASSDLKTLSELHSAQMSALKMSHEEEIGRLKELHRQELLYVKSRPWCASCGEEGKYYCCLNVSYCSTFCQSKHWKDHKGACHRRKAKVAASSKNETEKSSAAKQ